MPSTPLELPATLDLEQFISEEAHDLRTPFNHITGFSRLILSGAGPAYTAEMQHDDLLTIYRSGQRALGLINGLIDIARLNRHEKEATFSNLEIRIVLEQSIAYWKRLTSNADLQTECQILTTSPCLLTDEMLLRQVLAGFMVYVAQYVDPSARITLIVEDEPGGVVLTVKSQGKKTPPSSRLDLTLQGYVNRALVELLHGAIQKAEETDEGALVQFMLPSD